jgi:hypothetical protein
MGIVTRTTALSIGVVVVTAFSASEASASMTIGETFDPTSSGICTPSPRTFIQSGPASYSMPTSGVLTSWSYHAGANPPQVKLKVARKIGADLLIVGETAPKSPDPNGPSTYATRIPVQAGDAIGLTLVTDGECFRGAPTAFTYDDIAGDPAPGTTETAFENSALQFDISAQLEADADGDGYGDETQDECPADATAQMAPCPDRTAPETTITKAPKKKFKTKTRNYVRIKIKFDSSEAGSTFRCKLDGTMAAPCTSPFKAKVGKGKHRFSVAATDSAGNADLTPDQVRFQVKRRHFH